MLNDFKEFLLSRRAIASRHVPFYLKWVSDAYAFLGQNPTAPISTENRQHFLAHLGKTHQDWQIKQADTALRLYNFHLSRCRKDDPPIGDAPEEWQIVENEMRRILLVRRKSASTQKTYLYWVRHFRSFVQGKPPRQLEAADLQDFLSHLAVNRKVASSTQNQALNALVFLFRHVLERKIDSDLSAVRAHQRRRLPVVLTAQEVQRIFTCMEGVTRLMAMLTYGCGLRIHECLRLRIKDIDLSRTSLWSEPGKGIKTAEPCCRTPSMTNSSATSPR